MFFIGIFGVQSKSERIHTETAVICPVCEAYGRYEIIKSYYYFHFFFIPLWRWNKRYYIQTQCCSRICEIEKTLGEKIEAGDSVEIKKEQILCGGSPSTRICPSCSAQAEPYYQYCPHCGTRLSN
jgi:RNA polymerase subunit RPABC4/transcription elongation factor Spt4